MFGETGGNPVRARRREAKICILILPDAANRGQAIGIYFEKVNQDLAAVEISGQTKPSVFVASANTGRGK